MKKVIASALIITICFSASLLNAQTNVFTKGTSNLNLGLHIPTYFNHIMLPPISVSYDYGIADFGENVGSLGIGAYSGLSVWRMRYNKNWSASIIYFNIGPRVSYHFSGIPNVPQLDLYGFLFMGLQLQSFYGKITHTPDDGGDPIISNEPPVSISTSTTPLFSADVKVGAKYWFKDTFGAYAEIGWGTISIFEAGVSFKF